MFNSIDHLLHQWRSGSWSYPLLSSWGCPYSCTYCAARKRTWRARRLEDIHTEVTRAVCVSGVRHIAILDDCVNAKPYHLVCVCRELEDTVPWVCANGLRADRLTEQHARLMARSGCVGVGIGVETADPALLEAICKGETLAEIERGIAAARAHIPSVSIFLIVGLSGSSYETDMRTLEWASRQGCYVHASYYLPSFDGVLSEGLLRSPSSRSYDVGGQLLVMAAARDLASPAADPWGTLGARWRAGRRWGWGCAGRLVRMDTRKAWRAL